MIYQEIPFTLTKNSRLAAEAAEEDEENDDAV
jgi:hypothetical protein